MTIISSQRYLDTATVNEKMAELAGETKITLACWDAGKIDGERMAVLCDGHHRLAAAEELGISVEFDVGGHPEGLTGLDLLDTCWIDSDWYDVSDGLPIW